MKCFKALLCGILCASTLVASAAAADSQVDQEALAQHWAPTLYQGINKAFDPRADFPTGFDYDGDWLGENNWDNLFAYEQPSKMYYGVQETETHYFLGYYLFYPRDDGPVSLEKHENDLEGCLLVVRKDGSEFGSLEIMETNSHGHWFQYTNLPEITSGSDNVDGGIPLDGHRPKIFSMPNGIGNNSGHGIKAYDGAKPPQGDGIIYRYENGESVVPDKTTGNYQYTYDFELLSIDQLWDRRYDVGGVGHTFKEFGRFYGNDYGDSKANAPWHWDDPDDGPTFWGQNWSDPAHMVDIHLNGLTNFSHTYVSNPYYTHKVTIESITSLTNEDPFGGKSDIYALLSVDGDPQINNDYWLYNDAEIGRAYPVNWGKDNAKFGDQFSEPYHTLYLCKPLGSTIRLQIWNDNGGIGTSISTSMGYLSCAPGAGETVTYTDALTDNSKARITAQIETAIS